MPSTLWSSDQRTWLAAKTTWKAVQESPDPAIELLNSFCGLHVDPELKQYQEMPYTPEAANFFSKMLLGLCKVALELDTFFKDETKMLKAINDGNLLPWTPPN